LTVYFYYAVCVKFEVVLFVFEVEEAEIVGGSSMEILCCHKVS